MKPALDACIRKLTVRDAAGQPAPVIRIDIPRGLFVHKSAGGYFRRIGNSARELVPEELAWLVQQRSHSRLIRFDETVVLERCHRICTAISHGDLPRAILQAMPCASSTSWRTTAMGPNGSRSLAYSSVRLNHNDGCPTHAFGQPATPQIGSTGTLGPTCRSFWPARQAGLRGLAFRETEHVDQRHEDNGQVREAAIQRTGGV